MFGLERRPVAMREKDKDDDAQNAYWRENISLTSDRQQRYRTFDEMDQFDLAISVLDTYAEEVTQVDYDKGKSVWVESKNPEMVRVGDEGLTNLKMEDKVSAIARRICKYGDDFRRMIYSSGNGVLSWQYVDPAKVHRVEDKFGRLIGFREDGKKFRLGVTDDKKGRTDSWPWDYVHFRLLGKDEHTTYGTSMLDALFRPWRSMALIEDALLRFRLRRTPERNMVLVDTGTLSDAEAMDYVNDWRRRLRKHEFVDPASGAYQKYYNPLSPVEDLFIPVRGENQTRVETLSGGGDVDRIYDLNYFLDKFMAAARIPKGFLGLGDAPEPSKASLMQQDVRFARTGKRIRKALIYGIRTALDIHFALRSDTGRTGGVEPNKFWPYADGNEYVVQMTPISYLDEFERSELVQLRYNIVEQASRFAGDFRLDPQAWAAYILSTYAKLPEKVIRGLMAKDGDGAEPEERFARFADQTAMSLDERKKWAADPAAIRRVFGPAGQTGFTGVSNGEAAAIARAVHGSPMLRKVIGDIAWLHEDDMVGAASQQIDPSMLPVVGTFIEDSVDDSKEAAQLRDDLGRLSEMAERGRRRDGVLCEG